MKCHFFHNPLETDWWCCNKVLWFDYPLKLALHMTLCYGLGFLKFIINVNYRSFEDCPKTPIKSAKSGAICTACSILHFFINCLALSIVDAPQFYVNNSLLINPSLPISVPES